MISPLLCKVALHIVDLEILSFSFGCLGNVRARALYEIFVVTVVFPNCPQPACRLVFMTWYITLPSAINAPLVTLGIHWLFVSSTLFCYLYRRIIHFCTQFYAAWVGTSYYLTYPQQILGTFIWRSSSFSDLLIANFTCFWWSPQVPRSFCFGWLSISLCQ